MASPQSATSPESVLAFDALLDLHFNAGGEMSAEEIFSLLSPAPELPTPLTSQHSHTITRGSESLSASRSPAPTRNAVVAKANREKHRRYVEGLEATIEKLQAQNKQLQQQRESSEARLTLAKAEITNLHRIIQSESTIATMLSSLNGAVTLGFNSTMNQDSNTKAAIVPIQFNLHISPK